MLDFCAATIGLQRALDSTESQTFSLKEELAAVDPHNCQKSLKFRRSSSQIFHLSLHLATPRCPDGETKKQNDPSLQARVVMTATVHPRHICRIQKYSSINQQGQREKVFLYHSWSSSATTAAPPPNRTNSVDGSRRGTIAEKGRKKEKGKATPPQKCRERRWGGEAFGHPCTRTHARTRRATLKPPCAVIVTANVPVVTRSRPLFPSQSHRSQSLSLRASTPFR